VKRRRLILILGLLLLLAAIILLLIFARPLLQGWLSSQARQAGLGDLRFSVRRADLSRVDIAEIRTAGDGLVIPKLSLDYSLPQILKGRVRRLTVSGMKLTVTGGQAGWRIKGLENLTRLPAGPQPTLPFNELMVRQSRLRVVVNDLAWDMSFDLRMRKMNGGEEYGLEVDGMLLGRSLHLAGVLHPRGSGTLRLDVPGLPLGELLARLGQLPGIGLAGEIPLRAEIKLSSWGLDRAAIQVDQAVVQAVGTDVQLSGTCNFRAELLPGMKLANMDLQATLSAQDTGLLVLRSPVTIRIQGGKLAALGFEVAGVKPEKQPLEIDMIRGTLNGLPKSLEILASYRGRFWPASLLKAFDCRPAIFPLQGDFHLQAFPLPRHWRIGGRSQWAGTIAGNGLHSRWNILALDMLARDEGKGTRISGQLGGRRVEIGWNDLILAVDRIRAEGRLAGFPAQPTDGQIRVHLYNGSLSGKDKMMVQADGLELDLPWRLQPQDTVDFGSFSLKELQLAGIRMRDIGGRIEQTKNGYSLDGSARLPLDSLACTFKGTLSPASGDASVSLALEEGNIPPATQLEVLHPLLAGISGGGRIGFSANASRQGGAIQATGDISVRDAALQIPALPASISGLSGAVSFTDLEQFISAPAQRIQFAGLQLGNLLFTQGSLSFTIERQQTISIESAEAAWCGGRIAVSPLRYAGAGKPLRFTLSCQRVRFADLLNTLTGTPFAFGEAEINGSIPVRLSDAGIAVENGYLYTTPGIGGNLKFTKNSVLSGGQPLVEEAIKDFNYDWVRISLNSRGGLLQMNVELNGAPAQKLPLEYDSKTRNFIKSPSGSRNVELRGLHLELKFIDIDLNYILKHGAQLHLFD